MEAEEGARILILDEERLRQGVAKRGNVRAKESKEMTVTCVTEEFLGKEGSGETRARCPDDCFTLSCGFLGG